jgi:putative Holliday junction resolvase
MTAPPPEPHLPRRLLALDLGARRVGVAVSDELGLFAHVRPALHVGGERALLEAVRDLVEREHADAVVVGIPITMAGTDSEQTREVRRLAERLRAELPVPVLEWDERLSTVEASRTVKGKRRRETGELDSAAAAVVLQAVLDSGRGAPRP